MNHRPLITGKFTGVSSAFLLYFLNFILFYFVTIPYLYRYGPAFIPALLR